MEKSGFEIVISYLEFLGHKLAYYFVDFCPFLIWKNPLMYASVKVFMASDRYVEVVEPDCGSVMEQNIENENITKMSFIQG